jgi:hypothetical protein
MTILLVSCSQGEITNEEENQIFENIIISLLDSIQFSVLPPPYNDSIKNIYENDKMLIIIKDSTDILSSEDQISFKNYYKNISLNIDSSYATKTTRNTVKIKNLNSHKLSFKLSSKKYNFKFSSEVDNLKDKNIFFCGELELSNIKLDNSKKLGLFSVSYSCCEYNKCGSGSTIYIKKVKDKWIIDKIIPTWKS